MIVIVLKNAPPQVQGYLQLFFSEISAGVFCGKASKTLRESIASMLQEVTMKEPSCHAILAWRAAGITGCDFALFGATTPSSEIVVDGLKFMSLKPKKKYGDIGQGENDR